MADDSLATPVNKLPSVSTRETAKPTGDVSYADILKQQEMERYQFDQQQQQMQDQPVQPQFQEPMMDSQYNDPRQDMMQQPMMQQPMMQQPMMQQPMMEQPMMQQPMMQPPPLPRPEAPALPQKKWWRVWILENKVGWIVALVTFLLLTFIYPKIRGLQRFAGMPLPYWATGGMSVAGAAMVTAVHMSV